MFDTFQGIATNAPGLVALVRARRPTDDLEVFKMQETEGRARRHPLDLVVEITQHDPESTSSSCAFSVSMPRARRRERARLRNAAITDGG